MMLSLEPVAVSVHRVLRSNLRQHHVLDVPEPRTKIKIARPLSLVHHIQCVKQGNTRASSPVHQETVNVPIAGSEPTKTKTTPLLSLVLLGQNVVRGSMEALLPSTTTECALHAKTRSSKVPQITKVRRVPRGPNVPSVKRAPPLRCLSIVFARIVNRLSFKIAQITKGRRVPRGPCVPSEKREPHQVKPLIVLAAIATVANIKVKVNSLGHHVRHGVPVLPERK